MKFEELPESVQLIATTALADILKIVIQQKSLRLNLLTQLSLLLLNYITKMILAFKLAVLPKIQQKLSKMFWQASHLMS